MSAVKSKSEGLTSDFVRVRVSGCLVPELGVRFRSEELRTCGCAGWGFMVADRFIALLIGVPLPAGFDAALWCAFFEA